MLNIHENLENSSYGFSKDALVATKVPKSTRRLPIPATTLLSELECEFISLKCKIEPPYVLSHSLVVKSNSGNWLQFFDDIKTPELLLQAPLLWAPHEFNFKDESDNYMQYIQKDYHECESEEEHKKLYAL
jgi:hypothetical protein